MAPAAAVLLALVALVATAAAAPGPAPDPAPAPVPAEDSGASSSDTGIIGGLHVLYHSLSQCEQSQDMGGCLKLKAIRSLERALAADSVQLVDGLSLARAEGAEGAAGGRSLGDEVPAFEERALPEDATARAEVLDDLLADRASRLFRTRTLSFAVPRALRRLAEGEGTTEEEQAEGDNAVETGRRRGGGKKGGGLLMMGLLWKGWMTMMAYKGVAVLAGKALMTATIALVLAGILALSKLAHHGGHEKGHTTVEIVRHPHVTHSYSHSASHDHVDDGHAHGWGRALEEEQRRRRERGHRHEQQQPTATGVSAPGISQPADAQQMAYRAHYQRQMQQQQQQQQMQQQQQAQYQTQQIQAPQGEAMTVPL